MLPDIWGPYAWKIIHLITINYPENPTEQDKETYYQFFNQLQYVLPCSKCRYNYSKHLVKYPLTNEILSNRTNLVKWGIDMHNIVNYYTGKRMLTYAEAMNEITKLTNVHKKKWTDFIYFILVIVVLIILLYLIYYCYFRKRQKIE